MGADQLDTSRSETAAGKKDTSGPAIGKTFGKVLTEKQKTMSKEEMLKELGPIVKLDKASCPHCKIRYAEDAVFCRSCGNERAYAQLILNAKRDFTQKAWDLRMDIQSHSFQQWKMTVKRLRVPRLVSFATDASPSWNKDPDARTDEEETETFSEICKCGNMLSLECNFCKMCGCPRGVIAAESVASGKLLPSQFQGARGVEMLLDQLNRAHGSEREARESAAEWKDLLARSEALQAKCDKLQTQLTYLRATETEARKLADEKPALLRQIENLKKENKRLHNAMNLNLNVAATKIGSEGQETSTAPMSLRSSFTMPHTSLPLKALMHEDAQQRMGVTGTLGSPRSMGTLFRSGAGPAGKEAAAPDQVHSELLASMHNLKQELDGKLRRLSQTTGGL